MKKMALLIVGLTFLVGATVFAADKPVAQGVIPTLQQIGVFVIMDGKIYCVHSNWNEWPMTSSVEIWDTETMQHIGNLYEELSLQTKMVI